LMASHPLGLATTIIAGGFAAGALGVQMPLVMIESLGLKRFGSVMGITGIFYTAGAAASPVVTGRIFDQTGSYSLVIASFAVLLIFCSLDTRLSPEVIRARNSTRTPWGDGAETLQLTPGKYREIHQFRA